MKEGILFPLIMIAVTLLGGGFFFFYLKLSENKHKEEEPTMKTAQSFINVKNLKDRFLYTTEGQTLLFVRIQSVSIDLYSKLEKRSLMRQLTTELSEINYPFKFMALSRPVNIEPLIQMMMRTSRTASDIRREILEKEMQYLSDFTMSEDIVERQFYLSIWDKTDAFNENELSKRANLLAEKFHSCGVSAEVIGEKEIVQLINYVYNPSTANNEDTDYSPCIPIISEEDD